MPTSSADTGSGGHLRKRFGQRHVLLALPVGFALALLYAAASPAEGPTIEAVGPDPYFRWSPSSAQTAAGGTVNFKSSGSVEHGVTWSSGPGTPSCSGVPIDTGKTNWSGSCTFAQAGTYAFYCPVHPGEMKGTITASTSAAPPTTPPPPGGSPAASPALTALKIAKNQRGNRVRGSIALAQPGARLKADLLAKRASLFGGRRKGAIRVGRLIRSSLAAGRVQFAISLNRTARKALRIDDRLPLIVKLVITPSQGDAVRRTRRVVMR